MSPKGLRKLKSKPTFCIFSVILIILVEFGIIPVLKPLGFYCKDPKLSHKFKGDTISVKVLLSITGLFPLFALFLTEWMSEKRGGRWMWLKQALIWYRDYLSGLLLVFTVIVFGKIIIGEPRPHFLDTCQPKEAVNCTSEQKYIQSYKCSNKNASSYLIRDANKSFPSGHAAFSFYLFVFLAWFIQKRLRNWQPIILIWLQTLCFLWAMLCALTRITDHRHHWWDVLAGTIIGSTIAFCAVKTICLDFKTPSERNVRHISEELFNGTSLFVGETDCNSVRRLLAKVNGYTAKQHHDIGMAAA